MIHELCLCLAVTILLLIGGAAVLLVTKAIEGFELLATIGRQRDHALQSVSLVANRVVGSGRWPPATTVESCAWS